jgi:hypothetical protein
MIYFIKKVMAKNIEETINSNDINELQQFLSTEKKLNYDNLVSIVQKFQKYHNGNGAYCTYYNNDDENEIRNYLINRKDKYFDDSVSDDKMHYLFSIDPIFGKSLIQNKPNYKIGKKESDHYLIWNTQYYNKEKSLHFAESILDLIFFHNIETDYKTIEIILLQKNIIENKSLYDEPFLNYIKNNSIPQNQSNLLLYSINGLVKCSNYLLFEKKIQMNNLCFLVYLYYCKNDDKEQLEKICNTIQNKITKEELLNTIKSGNYDIMDFIIENKGIPFDKDCLKILISGHSNFTNEKYDDLFKNIDFNEEHIAIIIENLNYNLIKYLHFHKKIFSKDNLKLLCKCFLEKKKSTSDIQYMKEIFNFCELDISFLLLAVRSRNIEFIEYLINYHKLRFDNQCFTEIIEIFYESENEKILDLLNNNNTIEFNSNHLEMSIRYTKINITNYLIKKNIPTNENCIINFYYRYNYYHERKNIYDYLFNDITFTQKCLEAACNNSDVETIVNILNQKSFNPNFALCVNNIVNCKCYNTGKKNKILLLFQQFGYQLSEDNIIDLCNNKVLLDDHLVKNYKPTKKFYDECKQPRNLSSACKDEYWLSILCHQPHHTEKDKKEINKIIHINKIRPNIDCLNKAKSLQWLFDIITKDMKKVVEKKEEPKEEKKVTKKVKKEVVKKVKTKDNPYA